MKKLTYSISINAPVEKVWHTMLDDKTYREWTAGFHEGSYYKGNWEKGSTIRFLGPGEDGSEGGMVCEIADSKLYEFVSIKYLGLITNGVDDTTSDEVKQWLGGYENYTFKKVGDATELTVDLNTSEDMATMFDDMWPKALAKLKEMSEKN